MKGIIIIISSLCLLSYIKSSYCGSYIPMDETSCDLYTNATSICCYLISFNQDDTFNSRCYPFYRANYYFMQRTVLINEYTYKLNCGSKRGASCGQIVDPVGYKDCGLYSTTDNSCCFYSYKETTNCVWLGTSDIGTYSHLDTKGDKLLVICSSKWHLLSLMRLFAILILFT